MAPASATYQPRATDQGVLHTVIRQHLETFLAEAARGQAGASLPGFVEQEFRDFLTCGVLAHGFARLRRDTCAFERLVPFSCKGRGFCPSCGGRRMTEQAARLVDEILPRVHSPLCSRPDLARASPSSASSRTSQRGHGRQAPFRHLRGRFSSRLSPLKPSDHGPSRSGAPLPGTCRRCF